ncbi:MAG TPA: phytanoyl-CoA dioxygenase family protein, partial [Polyangiales bacterium]|nr:phytanoyl-CoA dioxygenase family protein [Polyangiales bacterium]
MRASQDSFEPDSEQASSYREKGYVVLRGLFTPQLVAHLRANMNAQLAAPTDPYQRGFDRLVYDTCVGDHGVYAMLQEPRFRAMMYALTGEDMFFTQGAGFSLKRKGSAGLAWHIESQSFGYQRAEDDASTLWTPLHPVARDGQRGGMRYVSRSIFCGKPVYAQIAPAMFRHIEARLARNELPFEEYVALRDGMLNTSPLRELLEHHAEEHDFAPGDALLMSKYVLHRSVALEDGPLAHRDAFAFRFVSSSSRYDAQRARDVEIPRRYYGYRGPTSFHLEVCQNDGERIIDSPLFDHDRTTRRLGGDGAG